MNRPRSAIAETLLICMLLLPAISVSQPLDSDAGQTVQRDEQQQDVDRQENGDNECSDGENCADIEENNSPFVISDIIGAQGLVESWRQQLNLTLERHGLSASMFGKLIVSAIVILLALILSFVIRKLLTRFLKKLESLGSPAGMHDSRIDLYRKVLSVFIRLSIVLLAIMVILEVWGDPLENILSTEHLGSLFGSLIGIVVLLLIALVVFELVSVALEHFFARMVKAGSPRALTLLPIARNVAYGALLVLFGITLISELGIDVMPLLAGAGVVGFAVGFGAQAFIKDIITGFIIIVEDLIQVGDVAGVGGRTGLVEKITIRKVQLRDLNGTVYTVPFSEIGIVENLTKDFSYYLMDISVAYRENTDEVVKLLKTICDEMRQEEKFNDNILEPIDILGVDKFADSAVIIKARIKTRPIKQWEVGREFNRRMKLAFDERDIEIPFPTRTLYFGEGKEGEAPAARVELLRKREAANDSTDID